MMITKMPVTTLAVVSLPTASAPPLTRNPWNAPIQIMSQENTIDFTILATTSARTMFFIISRMKSPDEMSRYSTATKYPLKSPVSDAVMDSKGMVTERAKNLGIITYWIGWMPMVRNASISSPTTMVAISAVIALPFLPVRMMAVMSGPSSLI